MALMAAPSLLTAFVAIVPAHAEETPFISIVTGLAPDDLLNVRAKPSAIGKTEARLAAGANVRNLGCNDIDGHPWCKIESDNPKATGWAPARYLVPVNPATVSLDQADAGAAADAATPTAGGTASAMPPAESTATAAEASSLQPDLTARLGGAAHAATSAAPMKSAAEIAMLDAYGLALAANETPSTGEIPALDTQTVAELPPQPTSLASGGAVEIPCARYVGQPMTSCAASIVHKGADKADITVTWPDGGTRLISFDAGVPAGSDAKGDFRFTREGSLSMIRIGVSERFEITDKTAFGDKEAGQ